MGNKDESRSSDVCRGVYLQFPDMHVVADFFPLRLGFSNVILGFKWLASLGDSMMN